eukprot:gnl/Dysnectes_brevis/4404_a5897_945.p1 GENE.gnl/Dysnectes_brevis/4404_a5897_945~~gnl/Dysnectes_brevis/4404_a5897_945.p1  ORF type:complete len:189 (+),score=9.90 gnl/Dysnectes_brevis/4404_a5897_945:188-754(+)
MVFIIPSLILPIALYQGIFGPKQCWFDMWDPQGFIDTVIFYNSFHMIVFIINLVFAIKIISRFKGFKSTFSHLNDPSPVNQFSRSQAPRSSTITQLLIMTRRCWFCPIGIMLQQIFTFSVDVMRICGVDETHTEFYSAWLWISYVFADECIVNVFLYIIIPTVQSRKERRKREEARNARGLQQQAIRR